MSEPINVMLVDDHAVVRQGLKRLCERAPDLRVVGEAGSAAEAYRGFVVWNPDVVVMDISLPDVSGIEALRRLLARDADARVLMFSVHDEAVYAERAMKAGARGYVTKASAPETLVAAVRAVVAGERYLGNDVAQALALRSVDASGDAFAALTVREFEIVQLLASGLSLQGIAQRMNLHPKTIANYQSAIRQKLGAESPRDIVRLALMRGLPERRDKDTPPPASEDPVLSESRPPTAGRRP